MATSEKNTKTLNIIKSVLTFPLMLQLKVGRKRGELSIYLLAKILVGLKIEIQDLFCIKIIILNNGAGTYKQIKSKLTFETHLIASFNVGLCFDIVCADICAVSKTYIN